MIQDNAAYFSLLFLKGILSPLTLACAAAAIQHATKGIPPCFKALGWIWKNNRVNFSKCPEF